MRSSFLVVAAVAAGLLSFVGPRESVRADDGPPPTRKPASPDAKKEDGKKDDATLRIERAKAQVKELEEAVTRAKAAQPIDAILLSKLMEALDQAKALSLPAKPSELTAEEKKAVVDEAKQKEAVDPNKPKDPMSEWQEKALAKAFDGADLSEEEGIKATEIVNGWYKENLAAMGDSKKQSDLKRKRDDDLEKAVGAKKAHKISNNLNSMGPGRR